jgi:hypothetical protein
MSSTLTTTLTDLVDVFISYNRVDEDWARRTSAPNSLKLEFVDPWWARSPSRLERLRNPKHAADSNC